jgi:hypothetical protein
MGAGNARQVDSRGAGRGVRVPDHRAVVVIGALLEGLPALLIFRSNPLPIRRSIGIDPVHYGIVVIAAMGVAFFFRP